VHDRAVGADGTLDDSIVVLEVNYYDLRLVVFIKLLSYTNIMV